MFSVVSVIPFRARGRESYVTITHVVNLAIQGAPQLRPQPQPQTWDLTVQGPPGPTPQTTWDLTVQGPLPNPSPPPDMFNLDLIVKGPTPALPWTCPNLFIMKYLRLASGRCASYWNVFLLMINPRLKLCKTYSGFG